jgi:hypothetical protein
MLALLEAILQEQRSLRRLLDEFFRVYLNVKFRFGKPTDRWHRRG